MKESLRQELLNETTIDDIAETYLPVVEIIGIEAFVRISDYAKGDELYFPKAENVLAPARNRRIRKEYNGYNMRELAQRYELTQKQIDNILKDVPHPEQMDIFDYIEKQSSENSSR